MSWETFRLAFAIVCIAATIAILGYLLVRRLRRRPPAGSAAQTSLGIRRLHAEVADLRRQLDEIRTVLDEDLAARGDALRDACREADRRIADLRRLTDSGSESDESRSCVCGGREGQEILRLSRQGLEPVEIARRMKMPVGEVDLVLRLQESVEQR
ncbi:MAG: DUF6115 domain-containing protein [Phycisphaerae bacterium]